MAKRRDSGKNPTAAEMARLRWAKTSPEERQELGSRAGKASAASLTAAQRKKRAQKAAAARWGKKKREKA